jgi:hypothetical protein
MVTTEILTSQRTSPGPYMMCCSLRLGLANALKVIILRPLANVNTQALCGHFRSDHRSIGEFIAQVGVLPKPFKTAQVLTLLKKSTLDLSISGNYGLISNLNIISKLMETLALV